MSERKVINKYFPPDFDPSKIPRGKKAKNKQQVVRLMAPFSMKCNTCAEYIYKGKKFNARKETVEGEEYYGIRIFRFYIKCTRCSAEITFKTDPRNTDYLAEHGAARNFEPWREATEKNGDDRLAELEREEADEDDPMKALENRTVDSKREMDILDKLQEIRGRNARMERADADKVLERISTRPDNEEEFDEEERQAIAQVELEAQEDEALVRKYFARGIVPSIELEGVDEDTLGELVPTDGATTIDGLDGTPEAGPSGSHSPIPAAASPAPGIASAAAGPSVKRKLDDVEPDAHSLLSEEARKIASSVSFKALPLPKKKAKNGGSSLLGIKPKVKPKA